MRLNKKMFFGMLLLFAIILFSNVFSATYTYTNFQAFQSPTRTSNFTSEMCKDGQDFLIQIAPFGCSPAVVRTDLLEESDVQVYCQLAATKINPLIDVEAIDSISFSGTYPKEIAGIGFHPAKSALGVESNLNTPVLENIGYVVITLRKQANASAIPDVISGNLTAKITYNVKEAFGIGKALFYIPEFSDDAEWEANKYQYGFWNGKGWIKVEGIDDEGAQISVYTDNGKLSTVNLKKGETSNSIYVPGFECQAGLKLKLENLDNPNTRAQLRVNAEVIKVAKDEKFLDNKCSVRNLVSNGLVQRIGLTCQEDTGKKNFDLTLSPRIILTFVTGGSSEDRVVSLGEKLYEEGDRGIYLGYMGVRDAINVQNLTVYLVSLPQKKDKLTEDELASISSLAGDFRDAGQKSSGLIAKVEKGLEVFAALSSSLGKAIVNGQILYRINFEDKAQDFYGKKVSITNFAGAQDVELSDTLKEEYDRAKADYESIRKSFSSEPFGTTSTYGEEALFKEISLAYYAGQKKTASDLCKEFVQNYPNSNRFLGVKEMMGLSLASSKTITTNFCDNSYKLSSTTTNEVYLTINGELKKLSFDGISEPSFDDYGVRIMANTPKGTSYFDLRKNQYSAASGFSLQLISADETSAKVQVSVTTTSGTKSQLVTLNQDVTNNFEEGYSFTLTKINLKKVAKVSLIPNINNAGTQADFGFKVGIEKRAIQLSPEKIKEMIKDLDKSIKTWTNVSDVLGNVTQGLKTACLVTGAALVVKNFLENTGGKGIARQAVMRGTGGWFEKCKNLVGAKTFVSIDQCLVEKSDDIDKDVEKVSTLIEQQNTQIKKLEEGITKDGLLSDKVVDTDKFVQGYSTQVINYIKNNAQFQSALTDSSGKGAIIDKNKLLTALTFSGWDNGTYTIDQLKNIELYTKILDDGSSSNELKAIAKTRLYSISSDVETASKSYVQVSTWANSLKGVGVNDINYVPANEKVRTMKYTGKTLGTLGLGAGGNEDVPIALVQTSNNKQYLVLLDNRAGTSTLPIKSVTDADNNYAIVATPPELANVVFQRYDSSTYNNEYKNAEIKYYETEPYKGMPAIVPFDANKGWYAAVKQTLPTGSGIASYEASGRVSSFWVCNVGKNGMEENREGDDICEMINTGTGQAYNQFPGITDEAEAKNLIKRANDAVEQASRISENQRKGYVTIAGQRIKVGEPAVNVPGFECQDFMSPKDCLLLFNVCDPVTCPSSRCDLGGAYPVKDVVQSGIIGSIALCLPNAQEGIALPVCLTGIKAGIDGFLSVKQSYKDCLQESLDTGKVVGICDEIYSIYICDFFWKQALPFADLIIPKIMEMLAGQNVRGGGEYMSVSNAWEGADKAISYFVNYYGTSSKNAFLTRTTESFTDSICKSYASAVVPSGADLLSELTSPDSPVQFHGRFDESTLTTATVPPTSHYKVFYHIYAGKDAGAYYQVYLKGLASSSYYQDTASNFMVASGYVAVGGYASETKDFTGTSGYKQLCINVNGQEECGFQEVSTSFAINYVEDKYLEEQAGQTDIGTEDECISGTISAYSLLNVNAQSAAGELINPEIYNKGIIRVCATANPGLGTDAYIGTEQARWKQVGTCGSDKIKCWLDTKSVEDVITTTTVEGEALDTISNNYIKVLQNEGGYISDAEYASKVKEIKALTSKDSTKKITLINAIVEDVFQNQQKAELLYLRGNAFSDILDSLLKAVPKPAPAPEKAAPTAAVEQPPAEIPTPTSAPLTLGEISGLSTIRQKVLTEANKLIGSDSSKAIHCWDAVYKVYENSDLGASCVYSDTSGKQYTIKNEKTNWQTKTVRMGIDKRDGQIIFLAYPPCSTSDMNTEQKLAKLQPGDLMSLVWNENWGHNSIFVKWIDQSRGFAQLFDWNGAILSGEKFTDGTKCDSSTYDSSWQKYSTVPYCKVFRYYTVSINDTTHPVYVIWQPTTATKSAPETEANTCSVTLPDIGAGTSSSISSSFTEPESETVSVKATMGDKIWQAAGNIAIGGSTDNAAMFVSRALSNAGVTGIAVSGTFSEAFPSTIDGIASIIKSKSEFSEVSVDSLKKGDIILIGRICDLQYSIGIFSLYSSDNKRISLYTNLNNKVNLETMDFVTKIDDGALPLSSDDKAYFYKAYRYTGDTKEVLTVRPKWTLVTAIEEANKRRGTYRDNQLFGDQVIFDGLLTEKECNDFRYYAPVIGTGQKDMNWLKTKILLPKCAQDPECKRTYF